MDSCPFRMPMKFRISIENKQYEVEVEVAAPEAQAPTYTVGSSRSVGVPVATGVRSSDDRKPEDEGKVCRSPLAGVVSEVKVRLGDEVSADQPVLVLEAMKMFTTITSPVTGKVAHLDVEKGQAVKQGQLLLEME